MRKLWQLSMAVVLTLVLGPYALAGITDTPPAPVAPSEPLSMSALGTIETPSSSAPLVTLTDDPLLDVAMNLLQGALSLF